MKRFIQFLEEGYGETLGLYESVQARRRGITLLQERKREQEIEQKSKGASVHLQENQQENH